MFPLSRDVLMFAVACAIIVLSAAAHSPYAEMVQNLGPVGPHEPILATTIGVKRIIAFYVPGSPGCDVESPVRCK
jgi:hypothetical protein